MKTLINKLVNHPKTILGIYAVLTVIAILLSTMVGVNYNLIDYLPDEMHSKQAIEVLDEEFGLQGTANVLVQDSDIMRILELKQKIMSVDSVYTVIWLDDVTDIRQPIDFIDSTYLDAYYKDGYAYMQVLFDEDDYAQSTAQALKDISAILGDNSSLSGPAVSSSNVSSGLSEKLGKAMFILIPILLGILLISTSAYFEVFLFLVVIGVSIVINNGTNILLGEISFVTNSASSLLQMAIAMDYSIFLLHRFAEEHKNHNVKDAMSIAIRSSFSTISASSITTVAGFLALTFMSMKIGMDLGLVLAKGIMISLICVTTLLPALAILSDNWIQKTKHRDFMPSFRKMAILFEKGRFVIIAVIITITIPVFLAQNHIAMVFSPESTMTDPDILEAEETIKRVFGSKNTLLLLVPKGNPVKEHEMAEALLDLKLVNQVQGLYAMLDPTLPSSAVPKQVIDQFQSQRYSRYIVNLTGGTEEPEVLDSYAQIRVIASQYYDDFYTTGATPSAADMRATQEKDTKTINIISILAVGLVLVITFKSLAAPILMLLIIQIGIWINMSVPYFMGTELVYMGYLIVTALQMGATIDYSILLSSRYIESRKSMTKEEASIDAVTKAGHSIITSSSILAAAGFSLYFFLPEPTIQSMGLLIGRGALISSLLVIIVQPQILMITDRLIIKNKVHKKLEKLEAAPEQ